ncbi:hypothetical protein MP228_000841 [Amoeboaphelidium protococcarum]|nr:hypothetical protein MP228_000841 [Amoeboaphelidium protococcarum]
MVLLKIQSASLQLLNQCLTQLYKVNQDVALEFANGGMKLSVINNSKSCFALIEIQRIWFQDYQPQSSKSGGSLKIQLPIKSLLHVTKSHDQLDHVEWSLCHHPLANGQHNVRVVYKIGNAHSSNIDNDDYLHITFRYKEGITRKHMLHYQELNEILHAKYDVQLYSAEGNQWCISPNSLLGWVGYFGNGLEEVSMRMKNETINFVSFVETAPLELDNQSDVGGGRMLRHQKNRRALNTELSMDLNDFTDVKSNCNQVITFSLKEFKAALSLCDALHGQFLCKYHSPGLPVVFKFQVAQFFHCEFVMATYSEEDDDDENIENQDGNTRNGIPGNDDSVSYVNDISVLEDPPFLQHQQQHQNCSSISIVNKRDLDEMLGGLDVEQLTQIEEYGDTDNDLDSADDAKELELPATPTKTVYSSLFDQSQMQ